MPDDLLTVQGVWFSYGGGVDVLRDISFRLQAGDYLGIVGPNGSGKSTMIRLMLGLMAPERGVVSLFGTPVGKFSAWQRIGYLPQRLRNVTANFPGTVSEVVGLGLLAGKRFPRQRAAGDGALVEHVLEIMGIGGLGNRRLGELSGGQQQRVLLARAMVSSPSLLILDEPTTALDPETRENFYAIIEQLNRDQGVTIVLVTHDTASIGRYANRLIYLDKRLVFDGNFDDFCRSEEMTAFFGEYAQHLICHRHNQ